MYKFALIFFVFVILSADSFANSDDNSLVFDESVVGSTISSPQIDQVNVERLYKELDNERYYVTLLAAMSMLSLSISLLLLKKSQPTSKDIVVVTGLNFVVFGTIIATLVVNTSEQLGAVTTSLGAMGGYLFGSWSKSMKQDEDEDTRK
ncbi:MAG: hypothetical protein OEZ58_09810 [Gammaproteobacteria bacterium]|nr:hypothetical protein [Gammaproteobacteria bacterium]MDH5729274.1 hypothetical protein [Gammaproteobacteria bacterium]